MYRPTRLTTRFLAMVVPTILFAAVAMFLVLVGLRSFQMREINRVIAEVRAQNAAQLLSKPAWNFDAQQITDIARSQATFERVHCVRVHLDHAPTIDAGHDCSSPPDSLARVIAPITHLDRSQPAEVGWVELLVDTSVEGKTLTESLNSLLLLLALLVVTLILCVTVVFKLTILDPLAKVGASLRLYREAGVRAKVEWQSQDELGQFVQAYNEGLEVQRQAEESLQRLGAIGADLTATLNGRESIARLQRHLANELDASVFAIGDVRNDSDVIDLYCIEAGQAQTRQQIHREAPASPVAWCIREGRELIAESEQQLAQQFEQPPDRYSSIPMQSTLLLPLINRGRTVGCMLVQSPAIKAHAAREIEVARAVARYAAIALDNAHQFAALQVAHDEINAVNQRLLATQSALEREHRALADAYREVERVSLTDQLTGLNNRRFIYNYFASLAATRNNNSPQQRQVFLLIDIDHFKLINDRHGHATGDRVLQAIADVLRAAASGRGQAARWGGEEFLLLGGIADESEAQALAERLRADVAALRVMDANGSPIALTVSVGFACWPFADGVTPPLDWLATLEVADAALYVAKAEGRNRARGYIAVGELPCDFLQRFRADARRLLGEGLIEVRASP